MAVIDFLPDRLNVPPVVYRGFTTGELGLTAGIGVLLGIPCGIPLAFIPGVGWVAIPTCMLILPLLLVFIGGRWISSFKRGKPENYVWRRLEELRARMGLPHALIITSRAWALKRSRPIPFEGGA